MFGILSNPQKHRAPPLGRPRKVPPPSDITPPPPPTLPPLAPAPAPASPRTAPSRFTFPSLRDGKESWEYAAASRLPGAAVSSSPRSDGAAPTRSPAATTVTAAVGRPSSAPTSAAMPSRHPSGRELPLTARCGYCNDVIARFSDKPWRRITNSYFVHEGLGYGDGNAELPYLRAKGEPTQPTHRALDGCLIQPLECKTCRDTMAFRCVEARADKHAFRDRVFYRLSKMILEQPDGKLVEPNIEPAAFDQDFTNSPSQVSLSVSHSRSRSPQQLSHGSQELFPGFSQADRDAVNGTNNGSLDWQEAHEDWTHATRRTLSPQAFAKRIKSFGGGKNPKSYVTILPAPTPPPPAVPRPLSGSGFHPVNNIVPPPTSHSSLPRLPQPVQSKHLDHLPPLRALTPSQDSLGQQRLDINRIDERLGALQTSVDALAQSVERLSRQRSERDSLDLLSETVTQLSSRVGDIDSLRLVIDSMKRRLQRLEDEDGHAPPAASSQQQQQQAAPPPPPHKQQQQQQEAHPPPPLPPPAQMTQPPRSIYPGARADEPRQPSPKRQRMSNEHVNGGYVPRPANSQPTLQPRPASLVASSHVDDSQSSWRPLLRTSELPQRRGRGRPRKHGSPSEHDGDAESPLWDHDSWQTDKGETDGFYNTIHLTQSADRGRIIRRGQGGGLGETIKRTRQKPVRNSEGILLRKDGKPDQRSISSPINLRKTLGKRKEMLENASSQVSRESHTIGAAYDHLDNVASRAATSSESPQAHTTIMKQMFPHGVDDDAKKLNHAANIFSSNRSPEKELVLPRNEMQHKEVANRRSVDVDNDTNTPAKLGAQKADAQKANDGSAFAPSANKEHEKDQTMTDAPAESTTSPARNTTAEEALPAVSETPARPSADAKSLLDMLQEAHSSEKSESVDESRWRATDDSRESDRPEPARETVKASTETMHHEAHTSDKQDSVDESRGAATGELREPDRPDPVPETVEATAET